MWLKALGFALVAVSPLLFSSPANSQVTSIPAADLTTEMTCEEAQRVYAAEVAAPTGSPEKIMTSLGVLNECGARAYNQAQAANHATRRAIPTGRVVVDGESRTVVYDLVVIDTQDEEALRTVCSAGAGFVGIAASDGDALLTPVITAAGNYTCGSYVDALMNSSSLLLVAPTLVPGINMTADVLRRVGVSERDISNGQRFINDAATTVQVVGQAAAATGVAIATGGTVVIERSRGPVPRCVRILGKRVCR